jgi:predicted DNA-binding transcriptional regulator AlpA
MRVLLYEDLRDKGIALTKGHLMRLVHAGEFPAPFKVTPGRNGWHERSIDDWLVERSKAQPSTPRPGQFGRKARAA